jgi:uncharacterized SAM-binding protein YcdF (DUF218 family)
VRTLFRSLLAIALLCAGAAAWDFHSFVGRVERSHGPDVVWTADAVAALTGAADARIRTGVDLAQSRGLPLMISGVHVDTTLADIARIAGVDEDSLACCTTLGRAAASTVGNGEEIADWARRNQVSRILVVTSDYHMERALLELRRAMPEGVFLPHPVISERLRVADWYRDAPSARVLASEWLKFRIASVRGDLAQGPRDPPGEEGAT